MTAEPRFLPAGDATLGVYSDEPDPAAPQTGTASGPGSDIGSLINASQTGDTPFEPELFDGPPELPPGMAKAALRGAGRADTAAVPAIPKQAALTHVPRPLAKPAPGGALDVEALSRQIGAMLIVGFKGTRAEDPDVQALGELIRRGRLGGVMFLKHNIVSKKQVVALTGYFRRQAGSRPVIISVDQEGGHIERLTRAAGFRERPSAAEVGGMTERAAARLYQDMALDLRSWGFNMNFGPVLDVNVNRNNPIVARYGRSYSADPADVARFGRIFVEAHRKAGVMTSVKHFPGHGSSTSDSHKGFVDISGSWSEKELTPFQQLARAHAIDTVMIGHLYIDRYGAPGGGACRHPCPRPSSTG
ncbi:glycoside hydrolase family 3 N-terminal domain-containing protein [Breoghania sp. L-A4]|uniref:glycoside hydrolase family 3 N-terminal domain-containing protein n=1 Tax=Breoghania sp. L-A4 TaxID=2304600 RepID=UPI000E359AA9|nr:glycoside hydrolase family 3 N-terminal domain-containing protein [Breoghania sp. L-A4]AXS40697.1 glycoside hydrolase family 3 protein [Breoghania sp. L-A4]